MLRLSGKQTQRNGLGELVVVVGTVRLQLQWNERSMHTAAQSHQNVFVIGVIWLSRGVSWSFISTSGIFGNCAGRSYVQV